MRGFALIYGSNGQLGKTIVSSFKSNAWTTIGLDFSPNNEVDNNVCLEQNASTTDNFKSISTQLKTILNGNKLDAIVNVAGGWAGGNLKDDKLIENLELMINQSVGTSIISAKLASDFLKPNGLLVLTGAGAAVHGTPGMIAYGMAKSAVHHLIRSCAGPDSGMPAGSKVVGILPVTIDTPLNRKFMPDADTTTWTPMADIANEIINWTESTSKIQSGELYKVVTEHSKTSFKLV